MDLRRAAIIVACMVAAGPAAAQAPWPQQQSATAPWPGQQPQQQAAPSPWGAPQQQQPAGPSPWSQQPQQPPPCVQDFFKLRDAAAKRADAIRAAGERKAAP